MNRYSNINFNRQLSPAAKSMLDKTIKETQVKVKIETYIKNIKPHETLEFEIDGVKYRLTGGSEYLKQRKLNRDKDYQEYVKSCKVLQVLNPDQLLFINGKSNGRYLNEELDCLVEIYSLEDIRKSFKTAEDYQNFLKENDVKVKYLKFNDTEIYGQIINDINSYKSENQLIKYENALLSAIYTLIFFYGEEDEKSIECVLGVLDEGLDGIDKYFADKSKTSPESYFYGIFNQLNRRDKELVLINASLRVAEFVY